LRDRKLPFALAWLLPVSGSLGQALKLRDARSAHVPTWSCGALKGPNHLFGHL